MANSNDIYLIDTNVLFNWLAAYQTQIQQDNPYHDGAAANRIKTFMEQAAPTIAIVTYLYCC